MRAVYPALILTLTLTQLAWAGEVTLRLPDEKLREVIRQSCQWIHCEADGPKSETEQLALMADWAIKVGSFGHYDSLADIQGQVEVRYDAP